MPTMGTMNEVANRTGQITLDPSTESAGVEAKPSFSPSVSSHLNQIYGSIVASPKSNFFQDVQHESFHQDSNDSEAGDSLTSLAAFHAYMASPASSALRPAKKPDLSASIADYFISSSHNTYLTGNQLYSDAAASSYINALLSGCRCVEIDVWDGEHDPEDSSDDEASSSSSSSDSGADEGKEEKEEKVIRRNTQEKPKKEKRSRLNAISSKIGSLLGHESSGDAPPDNGAPAGDAGQEPLRPEPKVLHGHTLTKGTTFRHVCNAIKDSAFVASDLPVIVSLEVHTSLEQQKIMVKIMEETWKDMLVEVTPEIEATQPLPAPEDLKRKILIKVKYVANDSEEDTADDRTDDLEHSQPQASQSDSSTLPATKSSAPPPQKPSKILHALSKLAVFTKGFHFSHFTQPEAKVPGHVFSLSESAARAAHANDPEALFEHNRHHFMRVYPYGLRVNSSNPDPTFFWRRGAQLVALNWQNLDKAMMLNHAMFEGEQGWVLKPQGFRSTETPTSSSAVRHQLDLSIEFLAGQSISLPLGDTKESGFHPYVSCSLHVETPDDEAGPDQPEDSSESDTSSYKRTIKSDHGVNPDFGGQKIQFPTLSGVIDELTFVRFKVKDDEFGPDSVAAWACIKLDRLQPGYRFIHLYDCAGSATGGSILVRITKDIS